MLGSILWRRDQNKNTSLDLYTFMLVEGDCIGIMVIRVVEFSSGGTRFLPKNQHTQRKILNF